MVKIIADSTCDLSKELIEKYNISILPLHIILGEKEYCDGINIEPEDIFSWSDANNATPKTSAPSVSEVIDVLKPLTDAGNSVICFTISKEMSSTANVFKIAAEELRASDKVWVIDSANLSTGIGLLVIEAAVMAERGETAETIAERMEYLKPLVRSSFVVDTLTFLHRGGRCSSISAMAGGVLKIHPKIVVENGKMDSTKKYRGRIDKVIPAYVKDMEEELKKANPDRVFITHSGCNDDIVNSVKEYLKELGVFKEILITRAGGVISSHCGPGTLGVLFLES